MGICQHIPHIRQTILTVSGIILEWKLFLNVDNSINTETAQSLLHPPADIFVNLFPDLRVLPVQIRLFLMEYMKILLVRVTWQRLPHWASEIASPVAGQLLPFLSVSNIKEISIFSIWILDCLLEPLMLI